MLINGSVNCNKGKFKLLVHVQIWLLCLLGQAMQLPLVTDPRIFVGSEIYFSKDLLPFKCELVKLECSGRFVIARVTFVETESEEARLPSETI